MRRSIRGADGLHVRTTGWLSLVVAGLLLSCSSGGSGASPPATDPVVDGLMVDVRARDPSLPLGSAFELEIAVSNPADKSVGVALLLDLTAPSGEVIPFHETGLFASFGETTTAAVAVTPAQWFAATGQFLVTASIEGERVGAPLALEVTEPEVTVPVFEDVTVAAGLETSVPAPECGQFANGAAWADVDGDSHLDLFVTRLSEPAQLFLGDGDAFIPSPSMEALGMTGANGAAFADYDNDGDADLFVARDGPDALLKNDGTGAFTDVSQHAGIGDPDHRGISAAWADYDGDGHLDVYVVNYVDCLGEWTTLEDTITEVEYHPDKLYRNNGDGTFSDMTDLVENDPDDYYDGYTLGAGFAAAWIDYNADGRPDLYLANDFVGPVPDHNRLWRNDGPTDDGWKFTDVSVESGTDLFMNTMGIGLGDFDRDGLMDMALSNIGAKKLLRNDAGQQFVEEEAAGVARPFPQVGFDSVTWGLGFYDLNLDGWEDLYVAAGNLLEGVMEIVPQRNEVFVSDGTGRRFLDVSAATGADDAADSKGVAFADYDDDGDIDLFVVNQDGQPRLFRNDTPAEGRHWLQVEPVGTRSNRDGCGAQVTVLIETAPSMTRQVSCGSTSVASGSQRRVHFGLGAGGDDVRLEITWPSGIRQALDGVRSDQTIRVEEPAE